MASVFPSTNSIPPVTFYNLNGLATWLNYNPSYKQYYINNPNYFPNLYQMNSTLSSLNYVIANVPLAPNVITLSYNQHMLYNKQINLFRTVYEFNSNAYMNYRNYGTSPIYYNFKTYQDLTQYKASVSLINKLYPFDVMANARNDNGSTLSWVIPFPL